MYATILEGFTKPPRETKKIRQLCKAATIFWLYVHTTVDVFQALSTLNQNLLTCSSYHNMGVCCSKYFFVHAHPPSIALLHSAACRRPPFRAFTRRSSRGPWLEHQERCGEILDLERGAVRGYPTPQPRPGQTALSHLLRTGHDC